MIRVFLCCPCLASRATGVCEWECSACDTPTNNKKHSDVNRRYGCPDDELPLILEMLGRDTFLNRLYLVHLHFALTLFMFSHVPFFFLSYNHLTDGDLNILLVVFQAVVAVICVEICKFMKWVEYPDFNLRTARLWAPVNVLFCLMLFTGMMSLQYNSVPMVTIFKNVTNILVTVGDYYCFGQVPEMLVLVAFGVMLSGAIAAAWNDISVSPQGLFWMAANCCSTAGYVLYLKFATKNVKLSKFGMVFYNNVLCTFFLLPAAIGMGQVTSFLQTPAIHTADYFTKNAFAGFVGFFLNFASLTCVAATGPTTYAIIGSLNKVPVAILGYILFDNIITAETWFFISVSMCGGFLYSYAKIQAGRKKALHQHPNDENEK